MGPGATTQELLTTLPTPMPARVLDVGCGAGSLALAAARAGAASVTAIDLDPRAVTLTRWNARLNDLEVAAHAGDLLAPVRERQFDLILAQPPFVPQPPGVEATTYLHGGSRGDELALRLLGELPGAMAPGGRALVLVDTAPPAGQATIERIRDALPEIPLQLSVITAMGHESHALAIGYAAAADSTLGPAFAEAAQRYAAHVEALGITHTRHALVVLRKPLPNEPSWAVSVEPRNHTLYGAPLLRRLDAAMALATLAPDDLVQAKVQPPAGAALVQSHPLDGQGPTTFRFVSPGGRAPDQELSSAALLLLDLAAQTDTVAALVEAYAEACEDDPARVKAAVLDFLRKALVSGMLEPREDSSS
ncbi:MAG: methyltransferase [bacterium]|nr:methyltransferase [bacterium]